MTYWLADIMNRFKAHRVTKKFVKKINNNNKKLSGI